MTSATTTRLVMFEGAHFIPFLGETIQYECIYDVFFTDAQRAEYERLGNPYICISSSFVCEYVTPMDGLVLNITMDSYSEGNSLECSNRFSICGVRPTGRFSLSIRGKLMLLFMSLNIFLLL